MSKKIIIAVTTIIMSFIILIVCQPWILRWVLGDGQIVRRTDDYSIVNEKNEPIKAIIFQKKNTVNQKENRMLIVEFENSPSADRYYLIILPDDKVIGRPNQSINDYIRFWDPFIYQSEPGKNFKSLSDTSFKEYNLIEHSSFSKDTIRFDKFRDIHFQGKEVLIIKK
jgi:hypothetical protein